MARKKFSKTLKPKGSSPKSQKPGKEGNKDLEDKSLTKHDDDKRDDPKPDPTINDPDWYSKDNQLVIDAASLPFSEPLGDQVKFAQGMSLGVDASGTALALNDNTKALPGILTMKTKASFGFNNNIKSPLNVAAQMLYTNVRVRNSGRKNYDAPDLMMYVISMADIYSFLIWAERTYAKAFMYSQRNKYIGEALLASENISHRDIVSNLANFRYWLNTYINKVASYAVPSEISYFSRRVWMYSGVYLENPDANIKDQLYQFTPDGFYRFAYDDGNAGRLEYQTISSIVGNDNPLGYTSFVAIGDWLLANVFGDEDFALMAGDIIKAFEGKIIKLASMPEEASIIPVYSEYVLEQFHNARVLPGVLRGNTAVQANTISGDTDTKHLTGDVFQLSTNGILYTAEAIPYTLSGAAEVVQSIDVNTRHILDLNTPVPTPIDVMEATRLMIGSKGIITLNGTNYCGLSCGSDIPTSLYFTDYDPAYGINVPRNFALADGGTAFALNTNDAIPAAYTASHIRVMTLFKYAPIWKAFYVSSSSVVDPIVPIGNINNYTLVDFTVLLKLHEVAMLSLLTVPGVAKYINTISRTD